MSILKVQCCGMLEQACGGFERELEISGFPIRVQEALAQFGTAHPAACDYLPYVACAVGDEIVVRNYSLQEGDTLALLPPVSGG
ncbi:MAG TPA: MoaD/ThiS family protein [Gammaproteobacteria bacterium]|nr:MoaD/ThiS family protein [Gammaproteobacteria bacterium]